MYLETFKVVGCDRIVVEQRVKMSDRKPKAGLEVSDPLAVGEILSLLSMLPEEGEEMIKMGDVETIDAVLHSGPREIGNFTYYSYSAKVANAPVGQFFDPDLHDAPYRHSD